MDYPIDVESLAEFVATAQPTREQMCADLAIAMGWTRQECPLHSMVTACWTNTDGSKKHQAWPPNPFDSADDSRALVLWLASQGFKYRTKFIKNVAREVKIEDGIMEGWSLLSAHEESGADWNDFFLLMIAPLPVIADAAWRAIQPAK